MHNKKKCPVILTILCRIIAAGMITTLFFIVPVLVRNPFLRKAELLYHRREYTSAFTALKQGLATYPDNENMAYLLFKTVNMTSSLNNSDNEYFDSYDFLDGVKERFKESNNGKLLSEIGFSYWLKHELKKAGAYLERAFTINPEYPTLNNYL
jgi:tetratricopeptide (TPR) repeat protein